MKTREEIEQEYSNRLQQANKDYDNATMAAEIWRDAALAELDWNRGARTGGTGMSETRLSPDEIEALRDEHREEKWSIDRDGLPAQLDSECFACCEPWPCDVARLLATYDELRDAIDYAVQRRAQG